ncbi:MAG: tRNA adenosine(34) deaminase TadA [Desulfomonilia bacterium]
MLHVDDNSLMNLALEEAREAAVNGEVPVGAVLVIGDGRIFAGRNRVIADSDPTAHAEIVALRKAAREVGNYRLPGSSLYVTLEPCIMCVGAIVQARVKRLVYGAKDPRYGAVESMVRMLDLHLNHKPDVHSGVLGKRAGELLTEFFKVRRTGEVPKWS